MNTTNISLVKDRIIENIRKTVGNKKVLAAYSGGIDSSCMIKLLQIANVDFKCIFVDHGLLRANEWEKTERFLINHNIPYIYAQEQTRFIDALTELENPGYHEKSMLIGSEYLKIFEEYARKEQAEILAQGTLKIDIEENHHNVRPVKHMNLDIEIFEPLKDLYKSDIRKLAEELDLPDRIKYGQPFPGTALAVRILGEIDRERLSTVRHADYIVEQEFSQNDDPNFWYFATLVSKIERGKEEDSRDNYSFAVGLRIVISEDATEAEIPDVPMDKLTHISKRIVREVPKVSRVLFDITPKPPGGIELQSPAV